jgi:hypothetical protein
VLIAVTTFLSTPGRVSAQDVLDVIAPVSAITLVDVAPIDGAEYALRLNGFKGRAELRSDAPSQRQLLLLEPNYAATRVDIELLRNGIHARTIRVLPVVLDDPNVAGIV